MGIDDIVDDIQKSEEEIPEFMKESDSMYDKLEQMYIERMDDKLDKLMKDEPDLTEEMSEIMGVDGEEVEFIKSFGFLEERDSSKKNLGVQSEKDIIKEYLSKDEIVGNNDVISLYKFKEIIDARLENLRLLNPNCFYMNMLEDFYNNQLQDYKYKVVCSKTPLLMKIKNDRHRYLLYSLLYKSFQTKEYYRIVDIGSDESASTIYFKLFKDGFIGAYNLKYDFRLYFLKHNCRFEIKSEYGDVYNELILSNSGRFINLFEMLNDYYALFEEVLFYHNFITIKFDDENFKIVFSINTSGEFRTELLFNYGNCGYSAHEFLQEVDGSLEKYKDEILKRIPVQVDKLYGVFEKIYYEYFETLNKNKILKLNGNKNG